MSIKRIGNVELVKVIKIQKLVGNGTDESPYQTKLEYWTLDGERID